MNFAMERNGIERSNEEKFSFVDQTWISFGWDERRRNHFNVVEKLFLAGQIIIFRQSKKTKRRRFWMKLLDSKGVEKFAVFFYP